jgi:serine/threonine protein kinase
MLGRGGTAPVFTVRGPEGDFAFKLLDPKYSKGTMGKLTEIRIKKQLELGEHDCPYVVRCLDGGKIGRRLFLVMSRAEGRELEKCLSEIPRSKIRAIVDQVAQAALFLRSRGFSHRDIKSANIFISDDFDRITLLDLSVLREISDPVGIGTDHGNELPVVATSRYTPPEYLFRLESPSEDLWHGVDIYQLGGLLHDLIMREPMFSAEYATSRENRYRFAWIVAMVNPVVEAVDVDQDLVLLARRALDKDWKRRRTIRLEDFLQAEGAQQQGLAALGLAVSATPHSIAQSRPTHADAIFVAKQIEEQLSSWLRQKGNHAFHDVEHGRTDLEKAVRLRWTPAGNIGTASEITLLVMVNLEDSDPTFAVSTEATLEMTMEATTHTASSWLPTVSDGRDSADAVASQVIAALPALSAQSLKVSGGK